MRATTVSDVHWHLPTSATYKKTEKQNIVLAKGHAFLYKLCHYTILSVFAMPTYLNTSAHSSTKALSIHTSLPFIHFTTSKLVKLHFIKYALRVISKANASVSTKFLNSGPQIPLSTSSKISILGIGKVFPVRKTEMHKSVIVLYGAVFRMISKFWDHILNVPSGYLPTSIYWRQLLKISCQQAK